MRVLLHVVKSAANRIVTTAELISGDACAIRDVIVSGAKQSHVSVTTWRLPRSLRSLAMTLKILNL